MVPGGGRGGFEGPPAMEGGARAATAAVATPTVRLPGTNKKKPSLFREGYVLVWVLGSKDVL